MDDGRQLVFGKVARMLYRTVNDPEGNLVGMGFDFANGASRQIMLNEVIEKDQMMARGLKEKLSNEGSKEEVTTATDMLQVWDAMATRVRNGTAFERASGGTVNRVDGILLEAYILARDANGNPITQEEAIKFLMAEGPDFRRILAASDLLKPFMDEVTKRRMSGINQSEVLTKAGL